MEALPRGKTVVVDEIQRLPALLNEVHRAIETRKRRFVLLGSSARRLKTTGTNLLAGRATVRTMLPFAPAELGADFDLEQTLRFGALAVIWQAPDRAAALEAYAQLYLRVAIDTEMVDGDVRAAIVSTRPSWTVGPTAPWWPPRWCAWKLRLPPRQLQLPA